jgi:hypothetical protein
MIAHFLLFVACICDLILGALVVVKLKHTSFVFCGTKNNFRRTFRFSVDRTVQQQLEWHREMAASHKCVQC